MPRKTNFEQVPLEVVKKVVEEQVKQAETIESIRGIKKKELDHLPQLHNGGKQAQRERRESMTHMLDIFRLESSGMLWLGTAASLECAKARAQELAMRSPGE